MKKFTKYNFMKNKKYIKTDSYCYRRQQIRQQRRINIFFIIIFVVCPLLLFQFGCRSATNYRVNADKAALKIIREKQKQALGVSSAFDIERPSNILRRRLMMEQNLPYAGEASLGTDQLKPIRHWPEKDYPQKKISFDPNYSGPNFFLEEGKPLRLPLMEALQVGARNSFDYQTRKEDVFRTALDLNLEHDEFRHAFNGQVESLFSSDLTGEKAVDGVETSGTFSLGKKLKSGAELTTSLAIDLANLLTMGGASSIGIVGDASVSIPLLRGAGKHIIAEPLKQAERNVVYSIYEFERFKRTFAVNIAKEYLAVLRQLDQVKNSEENYRRLIASARRVSRLSEAGRLPEIQVDQTLQDELRARNRWISASQSYKRGLDSFKNLLGLPPDAHIELDRAELEQLAASLNETPAPGGQDKNKNENDLKKEKISSIDELISLMQPDKKNAGPLEMNESLAIKLGLDNRLDLRITQGKVYDAQRAVIAKADALGAELTFLGTAEFGEGRSISSADLEDAKLRTDKGTYSALLSLDLPFERTAEQNAYRKSFISLERAVRDVQILEDDIKLAIRNTLGDLLESRESLQIQSMSVAVAQKRVNSINLFLEAGRAEIRDLLEAQEALLSAQNGLTAAIINYRIAELELQRDMGVLQIDEKGLWLEYTPKEIEINSNNK